ncbi:MAG: hypothetical protein CMI58_01500 [Parcubacteria group bacterium]|nr:hypothetical protein [Parcubacteria group bacterium]
MINQITNKKKFLIVSDQTTFKILGKKIFDNFKEEFEVSKIILTSKISNIRSAFYVSKFLNSSTLLIAVGSGTVNEICKYAAYIKKKEYIVFPTAPSNAYASNTTSITANKIKKSLNGKFPMAIIVDLNTVINSPKRLINSAFFDLVCRITAQTDCYISNFVHADKYDSKMYKKFFTLEKKLIKNYNKIFYDKDSIKNLFRSCIVMGLTTFKNRSSKFGSMSEHMISHYLDMFKEKSNATTHGEQIALTTYSMIKLQIIFFKNNKAPKLFYKKNEEKIINKIFDKKQSIYFNEIYKRKKLSESQIIKTNIKLEQNWKKLKLEFNKIIFTHKELFKIFKKNTISYKKFRFTKKLYVDAILYSKYLRNRFTILDIADNAKILNKNLKKII